MFWGSTETVAQDWAAPATNLPALQTGDVLTLVDAGNYTSADQALTGVASPSTTWTKIGAANTVGHFWKGVVSAPVAAGWTLDVTGPTPPVGTERRKVLQILRGIAPTTKLQVAASPTGGSVTSPANPAGEGQAVLLFSYADSAANARTARTPADGWTDALGGPFTVYSTSRYAAVSRRIPAGDPVNHTVSATRSGALAVAASLVVGDHGEAPPEPIRGLKERTTGAWVERPVQVNPSGTQWVRARVRHYGGPGWPMSTEDTILRASTIEQVRAAVATEATRVGFTSVAVATTPGAYGSAGYFTAPTTVDDPVLKAAALEVAEALRDYPAGVLAGKGYNLWIGRDLRWGSASAAPISGLMQGSTIWIDTDPSTAVPTGTPMDDRVRLTTHHEIGHLLHLNHARTTVDNAFTAAQPPGNTWLGDSWDDAVPGPGGTPVGFWREYSRHRLQEDVADNFAWLMTPPAWAPDAHPLDTDAYLPAQVDATVAWAARFRITPPP